MVYLVWGDGSVWLTRTMVRLLSAMWVRLPKDNGRGSLSIVYVNQPSMVGKLILSV